MIVPIMIHLSQALGVNVQVLRRLTLVAVLALASFGSSSTQAASAPEQAVVVHFQYGSTDLKRLFALEARLESALAGAAVGEYDGNEIATDGSDGFLYLYGPDADLLFDAIEPVLRATPFMHGAQVTKRYGPPETGVKESQVVIRS
jgi:hypothetical protein